MAKQYLDHAYGLDESRKTHQFYADWAASYDEEVRANGYETPGRIARALADAVPDPAAPLLDIGCGTGFSGEALIAEGFSNIDGCDFSAEMLQFAKGKNIYRQLIHTDLENPFPFAAGSYAIITAMGVITPGHAPPETIDACLELLPKDGFFSFSLNDHALEHPEFEGRVMEHIDSGMARLLLNEHGPHMTAREMGSNIYILQKL